MVTPDSEKRETPEYSLERVRDLAERGSVQFAGSRVFRDVENLGYAPENVHDCLRKLDKQHFRHSIWYSKTKSWNDVYRLSFMAPSGDVDHLYIKLKLNRDCVVVVLQSFHRDRDNG
ncbi:MAG: type II toxin-antitoxin system MqsR family toxin [Gammaproteobacteria bacterium]